MKDRHAERRRSLLRQCQRFEDGDPAVKMIVALPVDREWLEREGLLSAGRLTVRGRLAAHAVACGLPVPELNI